MSALSAAMRSLRLPLLGTIALLAVGCQTSGFSGTATLNTPSGDLFLRLVSAGAHGEVTYSPGTRYYPSVLRHVGPIAPGRTVPVAPFPDEFDSDSYSAPDAVGLAYMIGSDRLCVISFASGIRVLTDRALIEAMKSHLGGIQHGEIKDIAPWKGPPPPPWER